MAVGVNGKKRIFTIRTKQTTYQMMADAHGALLHLLRSFHLIRATA